MIIHNYAMVSNMEQGQSKPKISPLLSNIFFDKVSVSKHIQSDFTKWSSSRYALLLSSFTMAKVGFKSAKFFYLVKARMEGFRFYYRWRFCLKISLFFEFSDDFHLGVVSFPFKGDKMTNFNLISTL